MKLLLLSILLLTGCGGDFVHGKWTGNMCVTPGFSDDKNVLIYQATQEWKEKSHSNVDLQVRFLNNHDENDCDGIVFNQDPPDDSVGETARPSIAGDPVYIYLKPTLPIDDLFPDQELSNTFYSVTLHELGHYLGPNHSPYCNDIMYWKVNDVYHLSDNDVHQLSHPYPDNKYDKLTYCL